jgi:hypothetical protein
MSALQSRDAEEARAWFGAYSESSEVSISFAQRSLQMASVALLLEHEAAAERFVREAKNVAAENGDFSTVSLANKLIATPAKDGQGPALNDGTVERKERKRIRPTVRQASSTFDSLVRPFLHTIPRIALSLHLHFFTHLASPIFDSFVPSLLYVLFTRERLADCSQMELLRLGTDARELVAVMERDPHALRDPRCLHLQVLALNAIGHPDAEAFAQRALAGDSMY